MSLSTQPYKGARDFYPEDKRIQKYMFDTMRRVCERYGYQEYDAPILEPLELYAAKSGEEIVNEQTYSFEDRGGRNVAIRPEMTPTVSRMVAAKRQELAYPVRWYSIPVNWRYERPQRGRLREFWQLNADVFGLDTIDAETEMIQLASDLLREFGATKEMYEIHFNSRKLTDYILLNYIGLDERVAHDVIKLIDRKNKLEVPEFRRQLKEIVGKDSVAIESILQSETIDELPEEIRELSVVNSLVVLMGRLKKLGVDNIVFDLALMRGFDYYTDIVFEVFDTNPSNNRAMFGGGRYDGLVGLFGVEPVATVGFGMGDVTLQNFLESNNLLPVLLPETQMTAIILSEKLDSAQEFIDQLRSRDIKIAVDYSDRKLEKKLKSASKSRIPYVLFIGDDEIKTRKLKIKNLSNGEESMLSPEEIVRLLG